MLLHKERMSNQERIETVMSHLENHPNSIYLGKLLVRLIEKEQEDASS